MTPLVQALVFLFGTVIGSFLNAVVWRLRTGEGFVLGRSYCPTCHHELAAPDLVPVFSFLALRGKCRHCRKPIDLSYLGVELATGGLFLASALKFFPAGTLSITGISLGSILLFWYFMAVLVIIFVFDLKYMLIPRQVALSAAIIAFAVNLALGKPFLLLALGGIIGGGFFYLQYVISRGKWIGGGDVNLGILMGMMLGWPDVIVAIFIAYIVGAAVGIILLASNRKGWKSEIPFGTFLTAATALTLLWGQDILSWYLGVLL